MILQLSKAPMAYFLCLSSVKCSAWSSCPTQHRSIPSAPSTLELPTKTTPHPPRLRLPTHLGRKIPTTSHRSSAAKISKSMMRSWLRARSMMRWRTPTRCSRPKTRTARAALMQTSSTILGRRSLPSLQRPCARRIPCAV